MNLDELRRQALELSAGDRESLVGDLFDSLVDDSGLKQRQSQWDQEAVKEYRTWKESGAMLLDGETVFKDLEPGA